MRALLFPFEDAAEPARRDVNVNGVAGLSEKYVWVPVSIVDEESTTTISFAREGNADSDVPEIRVAIEGAEC